MSSLGGGYGDVNPEGCSLSDRTFKSSLTTHGLNQLLGECQPNPSTGDVRLLKTQSIKRLEFFVVNLLWDPVAGLGYRDPKRAVALDIAVKSHLAVRSVVLNCVGQKVQILSLGSPDGS